MGKVAILSPSTDISTTGCTSHRWHGCEASDRWHGCLSHRCYARVGSRGHSTSRTSPPGSRPAMSDRIAARGRAGNASAQAAAAPASTSRFARVSFTNKTTRSAPPSRRFSSMRRSRPWTSLIRDSASIQIRRPVAWWVPTASHARWSPGIGSTTSSRHRQSAPRRVRPLPRSGVCATSRIRIEPGYARTARSRPTAPHSLPASWIETSSLMPCSMRLSCEREMPTASATVCWLKPAPCRAWWISDTTDRKLTRARRAPRDTGSSRLVMAVILPARPYRGLVGERPSRAATVAALGVCMGRSIRRPGWSSVALVGPPADGCA